MYIIAMIDKEKISNAIMVDMIAGRNPHRKIRRINEWPDKAVTVQRKSGLVILHGDGKYIVTNDYKYYAEQGRLEIELTDRDTGEKTVIKGRCKLSHVPNRETLASMNRTSKIMEGDK